MVCLSGGRKGPLPTPAASLSLHAHAIPGKAAGVAGAFGIISFIPNMPRLAATATALPYTAAQNRTHAKSCPVPLCSFLPQRGVGGGLTFAQNGNTGHWPTFPPLHSYQQQILPGKKSCPELLLSFSSELRAVGGGLTLPKWEPL